MTSRLVAMVCIAIILLPTFEAQAATSSIRCSSARGAVAQTICAEPDYVAMDREIAALIDRGMVQFAPDDRRRLAQSQITYRKHRDGCAWAAHNSAHPGSAVEECVHATMDARLAALRAVVDRGRF